MARTVKGTAKTDKITVNESNVIVVTGKKQTKKTIAQSGKNNIFGAAGKDTIYVKSGNNNYIYGDDKKGKVSGSDKIIISGGNSNMIYGGKGNDTITVSGGSKNVIYGGAGKDKITINGGSKNTIYGGVGRDTYILTSFTNKTRLTINQSDSKFGDMDILQLKNVKKSDVKYTLKGNKLIITHKKNDGMITVNNWGKRPLSEIQFVGKKTTTITNYDITDKLKSYKYKTITKSGTYKATKGNDKFKISGKQARTLLGSSGTDGNDNPTVVGNGVETIGDFPVTKEIIISDLGIEGIDSLDLTYFNGGHVQYYLEGKDMILPMIENVGDLSTQDDDTITKIILKDFAAKDRIFELRELTGDWNTKYLIVNSGNTVQGTNGNDYIYVTKNGQSVFSNGGQVDEVVNRGYTNTTVTFSEDNDYAWVDIENGSFNVVKADGAKWLSVHLHDGSNNNTVIGATGIWIYNEPSNNNKLYCSAGDDQIDIETGINNTVYGKAGNDQICVYGNGNKFYGGAGKDIYEIRTWNSTNGTDIIYDYEFGKDTFQVEDSSDITDSIISGADILLNLSNGGSVKVIGAAKKGVNILDSSTGKTFHL